MADSMFKQLKSNDAVPQHTDEDRAYYFYNTLLEHWDKKQLESGVYLKLLFFNKKGEVIGMWEFPNTDEINAKDALTAAKKKGASSVVLGLNDPNDEVVADQTVTSLFEKFKDTAREFKIRLNDFLLLSKWSYNSFLENHRL